jgi:hypothetical protein
MSLVAKRWSSVPRGPAVYAMYGGGTRLWVAYVGIAGNLNQRLTQHFVNRDSSVTTGTAAAVINPDAVRTVRWWTDPRFDDGDQLHAAELVAFDLLDPALRSRGAPRRNALDHASDPAFRTDMEALFTREASGDFRLPWLWDIDTRVEELETRLASLERRLSS